jgi:RNA polymerase sigma factor (sigma-70 family)
MARVPLDNLLDYLRRLGPASEDTVDEGDLSLLRRFAGHGDEAAFTALVRRHGGMVWSVCSRLLSQAPDVEDAFQATFLILVRKANAIRRPDLLGPWLYGVARRVADRIRRSAARRRECGQGSADPPAPESTPEVVWRDLRPVLDEEVGRLPEKYRAPFVLCYLEGVTNEEAARRLRCPTGTVLSRLSRARERLRGRLVRRGVELTGAALASVVAANATTAAPAAVIADTVRVGLTYAAGPAAQAGSAVILAEGVLHGMFMTKVKMAVVVLLALGALGSGAGMFVRNSEAGAAAPAPARAADKSFPDQTKDEAKVAEADRAGAAAHRTLGQLVDFKGLDDPKTTLQEALQAFEHIYFDKEAVFDVNEKAFAAEGMKDVLKFEVATPNPVPPMKARLDIVLNKILSRLPSESGAITIIRKGMIEVTTQKAVKAELGIPEDRPLLPLVYEEFADRPLAPALRKLATASGFSVVLDRQAAGVKDAKVTADFQNVPVDTAVKVLADLADLGVVRLDNVLYVTSREKAARLQAEQTPPSPAKLVAPPAAAKPAAEPKPKEAAKPAP